MAGSEHGEIGTRESGVRVATADEVARWDELIAANPDGGDVWRGRDFAEHKREFVRYHLVYLVVNGQAVTVHEKRIPLLGKLWYLPAGPTGADVEDVLGAVRAIADHARTRDVFLIRIEPRLADSDDARRRLRGAGLTPVPYDMLPNASTVVLDISGEPDQVMARFSTRARRWIRRADRDGVRVERVSATDANCRRLYDLLSATAQGRFGIRGYDYMAAIWKRYEASGNGQLFFAHFEGEVVAGAFAMKLGDHALYKDGASVRKRADTSAENGLGAHGVGHAVQWAIIGWAKEHGCTRYDMCGTSPSASADDKTHEFHGITEFKRSFNKEILDHIGAYDLPVSESKARLWGCGLERAAHVYSQLVLRDFFF